MKSKEKLTLYWGKVNDAKATGKKSRIYAEMSTLPKASGSLVVDKLKRLGTIFTTLERMAIIGDTGWMDVYTKLEDPITRFDVRHFTSEQKEDAMAWIRE